MNDNSKKTKKKSDSIHHLQKNEVDFEVLWGAYPKFGEWLKCSAWEVDY